MFSRRVPFIHYWFLALGALEALRSICHAVSPFADTLCFLYVASTKRVREKIWRSRKRGTQAM
jgi:hypothetical protein